MLKISKHGLGIFIVCVLLIPLLAYAKGENNRRLKATVTSVEMTQLPPVPVEDKGSKEYVVKIINQYSQEFGINASLPLRVAYCESGYNPLAKNKNSTASGVFQFIRSTWNGTPEGKQGFSVFDSDANVRAAVRKIAEGGIGNWDASKSCWSR